MHLSPSLSPFRSKLFPDSPLPVYADRRFPSADLVASIRKADFNKKMPDRPV
jgi:hypothetical protein